MQNPEFPVQNASNSIWKSNKKSASTDWSLTLQEIVDAHQQHSWRLYIYQAKPFVSHYGRVTVVSLC